MKLSELSGDDSFLNLPQAEKAKVVETLAGRDDSFRALPQSEQVKVLNHFVSLSPKSKQSVDIVEPVQVQKPPKRQVGAIEGGVRGLGEAYAKTGDFLSMGVAGGASLLDKFAGAIYGNPNASALQDMAFEYLVEPSKRAVQSYQLQDGEEFTTGGQVANIGGNLAGIVQQGIATGGGSIAETIAQKALQGAVSTAPTFALPDATFRAQQMVDEGVDTDTALQAYGSNAVINTAAGALPVSAAGNLVKRAATGGAMAAGTGALARETEAQILGDEYADMAQDSFSVQDSGLEAGIGAVIGALLGKRAPRMSSVTSADEAAFAQQMAGDQPPINLVTEPEPVNLADVIAQMTGAPVNAESPQAAILREAQLNKERGKRGKELSQSELAEQIKLYGDELPPQYTQAPNNQELAVRQAYEEQGIDPDSVANTFARASVADQMELPQAQRDITARENTDLLAKQAFDLANTRRNAADSDLANFDQIAPDYQGGLSAATGGTVNGNGRNALMFGDEQFEPLFKNGGLQRDTKKGLIYGKLTDADGNTREGWVGEKLLQEYRASGNQRLAQDFMARSTQPRAGVGTGTRAQEKMPLRSTDIISGNEVGGLATRNLDDPYTPEPREPRGNVSVEPAPPKQQALKQPRQGDTIDGDILNASSASNRKQKLLTSAQKVREAANDVEGEAKQALLTQAEKIEAQAAKIADDVPQAKPAEPVQTDAPPQAETVSTGFEGGSREVGRIGGKNSTEVLTVRENGDKLDVYYNDEPLIDFNTEENVQVPRGASIDDIKAAVKKADQFGRTIISYSKDYTPLAGKAADAPAPKAEAQTQQTVETQTPVTTNNADDITRATRVNEIKDTLKSWLPDMDWSVIGGKIIRDMDGNVTGRTTWVAKDEGFNDIRSGLNVKFSAMREAVQRAVDGLPLGKKQKQIVDAVLRMHDELMKQSDEIQATLDDAGYTDADFETGKADLSLDDINAELRDAGYDERTNATEAKSFADEGEASRTDSNAESEDAGTGRADDFTLERETNADIERREREVAAREKAVKDAEKAAADKAKADAEVNDFTLTGSDRATDANPNQGDIFSQPQQNVEVPDPKQLSKQLDKLGYPHNDLSRKEKRVTINNNAIFGKDKFTVDIELRNGKWQVFEAGVPDRLTIEQIDAITKFREDLAALNGESKPQQQYDANVEQVRNDTGFGGGTFYSGLPLDAMYKAVNSALEKLFSSKFFENQRAETEARRRAFKAAEEADKKASGSDKGGFRRGVEFTKQQLNSLISGQTAVLDAMAKKHNSPTVAKIAAMFSDRAGTGDAADAGITYYQDVEQHFTKRLNDVVGAIGEKNLSDDKFWDLTIRRIKAGKFDESPTGKAAKGIAKLLSDELERLRERGVDIGEYKNYYPDREINTQAALHNGANFVKAATAAFVKNGDNLTDARAKAESWYKHIILDDADASGSPFMPPQSGSPDTSFIKARSLSNEASQVLRDAGFYFDNPLESLTTYFYRTSRKAAYEARFGGKTEDGKGHAKYRELEDAIMAEGNGEILEDVRRHIISLIGEIPASDVSSGARKAVSFFQSLNVITYLSGVGTVLTSLGEPIIAGARTNNLADAPKSVYYSVRNIASRSAQKFLPNADWAKSLSTEQSIEVAEMIGVMSNRMLSDTAINNRLGGNMINRKADLAVQTALRWNGLHGFTQLTRAASVEVGAKFINSLSKEIIGGKAGKLTKDLLSEMGIPEAKHAEFAKYVSDADKGKYGGLTVDELAKQGDMNELYRNALYKFSTQVIQSPNKGQQPRLASHPVGKMAYSLLSYAYSYHENVLKRAGRHAFAAGSDVFKSNFKGEEAKYSNMERMKLLNPAIIAMGVLPLLQMALLPVRDQLNGVTEEQKQKRKDRTVAGIEGDTFESIQRSGAFGRYDPIVNAVLGLRYDRELTAMLYGASAGGILNTTEKGIGFFFDDKNTPNTNTYERSLANSVMATVVEPTLVYMGTKVLNPLVGVPLQMAVKNKNTREEVTTAVAGEKTDKRKKAAESSDSYI